MTSTLGHWRHTVLQDQARGLLVSFPAGLVRVSAVLRLAVIVYSLSLFGLGYCMVCALSLSRSVTLCSCLNCHFRGETCYAFAPHQQ
jgi:hypothetical protein